MFVYDYHACMPIINFCIRITKHFNNKILTLRLSQSINHCVVQIDMTQHSQCGNPLPEIVLRFPILTYCHTYFINHPKFKNANTICSSHSTHNIYSRAYTKLKWQHMYIVHTANIPVGKRFDANFPTNNLYLALK